jgi:hypothetical protein
LQLEKTKLLKMFSWRVKSIKRSCVEVQEIILNSQRTGANRLLTLIN